MIDPSRAAEQAAELDRAERNAKTWHLEEFSLAGLLVWALTPKGQRSVVSGLLDLIERQLSAVSLAESEGQESKPWTRAAHRFTLAARELDRRERGVRAAAESITQDEVDWRDEEDEEDEEAEEDEEDDDDVEAQEAEVTK